MMKEKQIKNPLDSITIFELPDITFSAWLHENKKNRQYNRYLPSLVQFLGDYGENGEDGKYHLDTIFRSMKLAIQKKKDTINRLDDLCNKLNKAATMTKNFEGEDKKIGNLAPNTINDYCVALNCYIEYLKKYKDKNKKDPDTYKYWGAKEWDKNLTKFWKKTVSRFRKDGYGSLLSVFCNNEKDDSVVVTKDTVEDMFVKLAVENSYFFSQTLVNNRQGNIIDLLKYESDPEAKKGFLEQPQNVDRLYARKSTDDKIQKKGKKNNENGNISGIFIVPKNKDDDKESFIPIWIDRDGNKAVRDLIARETGFTVSSGYDNFFVNFKISHIWGNAFDPRFFTSLWNIVLVPSWANDLLDKHGSEMSLAQKMINTYKAICEILYGAASLGNKLGVNPTFNPNYVAHGTYEINVLNNTTNGTIGTIRKVSKTV